MAEVETYTTVTNETSSNVIELEIKVEFGSDPLITWQAREDANQNVYVYIEREIPNESDDPPTFEKDPTNYQNGPYYDKEDSGADDFTVPLDENKKTRVHVVARYDEESAALAASAYIIFNPKSKSNQNNSSIDSTSSKYVFFDSSSGLSEIREKSYGVVDGSVSFLRPENYDINNLASLTLLYQPDGLNSWLSANINIPQKINTTENKYSFNFENLKISVPSNRAVVSFKLQLEAGSFYGRHFSEIKKLTFASASDLPLDPPSNTQAELKYEITTTISESYFAMEYSGNIEPDSELHHYFNDESKYKTIRYTDQTYDVFTGRPSSKGFIYQSTGNSSNLKGFFYPACVSQILPCINLIKISENQNEEIKLSWKIIDNFFDYSFLSNQLRVETDLLTVKVEYYDGGSYELIKDEISLINGINYTSNFFVISLRRDEIDSGNLSRFNKISLSDNNTDNLRITIVKHHVYLTTPVQERALVEFTGNLLLPPKWTHILYDRYRDTNIDTEEEVLKIKLDSVSLRGIVLPEAGFKKNISMLDWVQYSNGSSITQSTKIFYKLTTQAKALYLDPIREGTIVYVQLPSSGLDDVFLTPPTLKLPPPNIDANGKQAEGEVVLNEYGKIAGIRITEPGYGYSMFKTEADKRTQTFVDYLPLVKSRYHIRSTNSNITKETLVPQNPSFSRLIASLSAGAKLNDPNGNNLADLNPEQQEILKEYLRRTGADLSSESENTTTDTYVNRNDNSSNNVTIQSIDLEWYNISKLYSDSSNNPLDEFNVYNLDTDANIDSVEDSKIKDEIEPAQVATDISNTDITLDGQSKKTADSSSYTLNELPVFTDASAASSVFNPTAGPPWLTLLPLDKRSDGAAAHGALPNMLTRGDSFFNRIVDGINNLNQVRLILPTVWAQDLITTRSQWFRDPSPSADGTEYVTFAKQGDSFTKTTVVSSVVPSNSSTGFGAKVYRTVRKRDLSLNLESSNLYGGLSGTKIESEEYNQSMNITPMIHPWMEQAIPSFFTQSLNKKYLAFAIGSREECDRFIPFQENGFGVLNGCGTSVQIPPGTSVPDGRIVTTSTELTFFNGGTISLTPNGSAEAFTFGASNGGFCNTYSCASLQELKFDFRYSNMYPAILNIP